jgi:kynurenine formamidase
MSDTWIIDHEVGVVIDIMRNGWSSKKNYYYFETFEAEFAEFLDRAHVSLVGQIAMSASLIGYES